MVLRVNVTNVLKDFLTIFLIAAVLILSAIALHSVSTVKTNAPAITTTQWVADSSWTGGWQ